MGSNIMPEIGFKKGRRKKENKEKKRDNIYSQKIDTEVDENWKICDYRQEWIKHAKGNIMLSFFFFFFKISLQWKPFSKI